MSFKVKSIDRSARNNYIWPIFWNTHWQKKNNYIVRRNIRDNSNAYISRKNCMSAFLYLYESNTVNRMKIDQTWSSITNTKANIRTCHIGEQLTLDPQNNFSVNNETVYSHLSAIQIRLNYTSISYKPMLHIQPFIFISSDQLSTRIL